MFLISCSNKDAMVSDCWDGEDWSVNFRRSFVCVCVWGELIELEDLLDELDRHQLGEGEDDVHW